MNKNVFLKLLVIPCVVSVVALYLIGFNIYMRSAKSVSVYKNVVLEEQTDTNETELINLNTATKEELMLLDGIGEKYADEIIKMRDKVGGFNSVDQLLTIKGIGEKLYNDIKDFVEVE